MNVTIRVQRSVAIMGAAPSVSIEVDCRKSDSADDIEQIIQAARAAAELLVAAMRVAP
jgi:hypothetical protein